MKKVDWKTYIFAKLKIASFILALVGCFLLFIFLFGKYFEKQLIQIEPFVQSDTFQWGVRLFVFALVILLIKGDKLISKLLRKQFVRFSIYLVFTGGGLGWMWYFVTLIL